MAKTHPKQLVFTSLKGRQVQAGFDGGEVSSDGGLVLVREVDRKLGLIGRVAGRLADVRQSGKVVHSTETMLRQRVMGLVAGWEDLNDASQLRHDRVHQIAAGSAEQLASAPTLCRFFHGYYDCHCFLPLYVFCGDQLLVAYLRPSNIDAARHAAAVLKLLVKRLRRAWPRTRIVFRADSGFCRDLLLSWCDRHDVKYVVGIARNERLLDHAADLMEQARERFERTGEKQRLFKGFDYAALTWRHIRWVIAKAEHGEKGSNPRFIITNIVGDPQKIYDRRYCRPVMSS